MAQSCGLTVPPTAGPRRLARVVTLAVIAAVALTAPSALSARVAAPAGPAACKPATYRVKLGDTLYSIARRFDTTVAALAKANSLDPNGVLVAGTVLKLPSGACKASTARAAAGEETSRLVSSLDRALATPGVSRPRTGVVVVDLDAGDVVYAVNPELALEPASTEKLGVAITALQRLGPGFRTHTDVFGRGSLSAGVWHGDLVLKGFGDPALSSAGLDGLARAVRRHGIQTVTGRVVGDESYFDAVRTCPGWKPEFAKNESPLLSALVVNRGVIDGHATDFPALAAAILFTRALHKAGVSVAGEPTAGTAGARATRLARRASPPLTKLLARMDTWSDNFIAEMLLKGLGARLGGGPGSTASGAAVVGATLAADGVPLAGVVFADASGLSRLDRQTARSLAAMLETVWHEPKLRTLASTFAVAGSTGTLRHRLLDVPGHTLVRGKTGTTDDSSALVGLVGTRFAFAVLNNGSPVDFWAAHLMQDRVAEALLAVA